MIKHVAQRNRTARSGAIRGLLLVMAAFLLFLVLAMSGLMIYALVRGAKESEFDPHYKEIPQDPPLAPRTQPEPPNRHPSD